MTSTHWQKQGAIPGGTVLALAAIDQICLAGTLAGLHRSEDGGRTWLHLRYGDAIHALAMASSEAAFAASESGRLLYSADAGRNWRELSSWQFGTATAIVLAPDFVNAPHVFVATADGIFRSLDGGESWQEANFGLLDTDVLCLAIAPDYAESGMLWAGTVNGGLYRSRNAGRAWRESGDGLAEGEINTLAVSPHFAQDHLIFVGLSDVNGGVFVSSNAGENWRRTGCDDEINALAISPSGTRLLAAATTTLHSYDVAISTWESLADMQVLTLAWSSAARVLAGTWTEGVAVFNTGVERWEENVALSACVLPVVTASGQAWLALDSQGHVLSSRDRGVLWADIGQFEGAQSFADGASIRYSNASMIVLTHGLQVWNGSQWTPIPLPLMVDEEARVVHVPTLHKLILGTHTGQVYISSDGAQTWLVLPALAAGAAVMGVYAGRNEQVYALVTSANTQGQYSAEVWMCISVAEAPWQLLMALDGLPAPLATMQVCEKQDADVVVLAAQNNLVAREIHAEGSGEPKSFVLDPAAVVTTLRPSPFFERDGVLFVGTNTGVFQLRHSQTGWSLVEHALENRPVMSLFEDEGVIGASVLGGEVWVYRR